MVMKHWDPGGSVAEVALARLVQERAACVSHGARDLLADAVLALHATAAQVTTLHTGFGPLNTAHLSHFGKRNRLTCRSSHQPSGNGGRGGFSHPAENPRERETEEEEIHHSLTFLCKFIHFIFLLFFVLFFTFSSSQHLFVSCLFIYQSINLPSFIIIFFLHLLISIIFIYIN